MFLVLCDVIFIYYTHVWIVTFDIFKLVCPGTAYIL